jgi:predicted esterase YcpF (UPF0227 family)
MKILFAHGLASSGAYKLADMLRMTLRAEVVAPDLPIDPSEALELLRRLCGTERPDLVVGLSWGGFLSHRLQGVRRALINPDLHVSRLMRTMVGSVPYLSPRKDGATAFEITPALCDRYEALEGFVEPSPDTLLGLFADQDELVRCSAEFAALYPGRAKEYPGKHLPTFPEVKKFIAPALFAYMESNP